MENCQNCDTPLQGKFCYHCGQKVIEPSEQTMKHLIYQFLGSAFFLENNFLKNLWGLITKPGKIPLDFIEGRRKRWMPPFSLFFLINLFYFWYSPMTDLNLSLRDQIYQPQHKNWAERLVHNRLKSEGITFEEYETVYNRKSTGYANSLVILQIPIFAGFLSLIFFRKKLFFVDHFIFGLYFFAFILLMGLIQSGIIYALVAGLHITAELSFMIMGWMILCVFLLYLFLSLRKTYQCPTRQAALYTIPVFIAFLIGHFIYRTMLFLIIFAVT